MKAGPLRLRACLAEMQLQFQYMLTAVATFGSDAYCGDLGTIKGSGRSFLVMQNVQTIQLLFDLEEDLNHG